MRRRALKRAAEQRILAGEEQEGALSDAADEGGSDGGFGVGLEAGYDPLGSPPPGRERKGPHNGSLIGSLRSKRAMEPEWSVAAADEEGGALGSRQWPLVVDKAGGLNGGSSKGAGIPAHLYGHHMQSTLQDGIEMQSPRCEDGSAAGGRQGGKGPISR